MVRKTCFAIGMLFLAQVAGAQFTQQGNKLVGSSAVGAAYQGGSVAISADGSTAILGGFGDDSGVGAVWVFTRSSGVWSQQGSKLVGTGAIGTAGQGKSAAISADGNTAIVGGWGDSSTEGAAWVFTRSGGVWSQQGAKLVGTGLGFVGGTDQGTSVAISADGNTAVVGGPDLDLADQGATWVFTRSGGVWSQQGVLVGNGAASLNSQGISVAISSDGNTVIVGGQHDDDLTGAAWVFTRSGGVWSQQGPKLVGTGADGAAWQGTSVAISADGNTALVGGPGYQDLGAVWVFTRSGGVWSQQGPRLVGTGADGAARQGTSVAISGDGNTAFVGGSGDNSGAGATWVFTRSGGVWSQKGDKLVAAGAVGDAAQGASVALSADGTTALVGGPGDPSGIGAAWVFTASMFASWVPAAAHTDGLNGSRWRSDLGLLNPGGSAANVQLQFFGSDGVTGNTVQVPAGTQSILTDVVGQLGAGGQGALEVLADQPLKLTARTYTQAAPDAGCFPGGTHGQEYPVLAAGEGLSAGQSAYLPGLVENAAYRCNIGVVSTDPEGATVLIELYDGAGTKLAEYTVGLAHGQWAQENRPFEKKAGQTAMDRGYAKVTVQSGSGVSAFASVIDNVTNDPNNVTMQR